MRMSITAHHAYMAGNFQSSTMSIVFIVKITHFINALTIVTLISYRPLIALGS